MEEAASTKLNGKMKSFADFIPATPFGSRLIRSRLESFMDRPAPSCRATEKGHRFLPGEILNVPISYRRSKMLGVEFVIDSPLAILEGRTGPETFVIPTKL